jgi:PAS domain S-box-containing protein
MAPCPAFSNRRTTLPVAFAADATPSCPGVSVRAVRLAADNSGQLAGGGSAGDDRHRPRATSAETEQAVAPGEQRVEKKKAGSARTAKRAKRPRVFQEELLAKKEELRRAREELEATRDQFIELYDFAPNGYLTLDPNGIVRRINLTGAAWLGKAKHAIEGQPLSSFVRVGHRTRLVDFMRRCRQAHADGAQSVSLGLRAGGAERDVEFVCRPHGRTKDATEFFVAMIDVTVQRKAEAEREEALADAMALSGRLLSVQEEERQRIARDLHDNFGQHLTGLRLTLQWLATEATSYSPAIRERIRQSQEAVDHLDETLDQMAADLRPAALDLGFEAAVAEYVRQWSEKFGVPAEFDARGQGTARLPPEAETHLYRITQEALNNVFKHAQAAKVNVLLERRDDALALIVEDNGLGFDPDRIETGARRGLGLTGMRERASLIGGRIEVETSTGAGTTIFVHVPITARRPTAPQS